jgi:serine/threonine-protein kinase RsbW
MTSFAVDIVPDTRTIARLSEEVAQFLRGAAVDPRALHHVVLVIDEILTNIASHGGKPVLQASIMLDVGPDRICGKIADRGTPFDPRSAPPAEVTMPWMKRKIGGLGLYLVQQLTSALDYRREGDLNWTTFCILREHA